MFITSLLEVFSLGLLVIILNFFLESDNENNSSFIYRFLNNFVSDKENSFYFILSIFFIIFLIKLVLLIYLSWSESVFQARFKERVSNLVFNSFLNRSVHQLLKKNSSTYLRNFTTEIDQTTTFYYAILKLILDVTLVLMLFAFLVTFDPLSSLSTMVVLMALSLIYFFLVKNFISNWGKKRIYSSKKKIQFVNESFAAIKDIKILSRENFFFNRFKLQNSELTKILFKMSFVNNLPKLVLEFFLFAAILLILIILINYNYAHQEIVKIISIYVVVLFRLIPSTNRILGNIQTMRFTYPAFDTIYSETKIKTSERKEKNKKLIFNKEVFININKFDYNTNSKFALKKINIKFKKKDKIGIIGSSGSGKSTLIDIICGFMKINNGNIFIDKKSIYNNLPGWQQLIGYIPQKIVILNDSLKNNILFGLDKKKYSDKKVFEIIKKANLTDFYKKLPNGLNAKITEEGLNISGGEIQRIGIARALINNPEIIFLDEATSALDTFTENKILKEIYTLNKTIIFVSHRINSLRYCNKIYHIEKGKIKDYGNFKKFYNKHVVN